MPEGTGLRRMVDGKRIRGLGVVVDGAQTHLRPLPNELGAAEELSFCLLQPNPRRVSGLELGEPAVSLFELHAVLLQLRRDVWTERRRARKRPGHVGVWVQLVPSDHVGPGAPYSGAFDAVHAMNGAGACNRAQEQLVSSAASAGLATASHIMRRFRRVAP